MAVLRIILLLTVYSAIGCGWVLAGDLKDPDEFPDLLSDEFAYEEARDSGSDSGLTIYDPLEPVNRVFFEFNDTMYEWLVKPVTDGYIWLIPRDLRVCFNNFFVNVAMPIRLMNTLLQADFESSGVVAGRFLINSTLGVYGLVDIADLKFGLHPQRADFGQTLAKWGVGEGIFFYWPFFGPSNARDTVGLLVDVNTHPIPYIYQNTAFNLSYYSTDRLNTLSLNPDLYDDLKKFSLDPYVAARQAYYEYRKSFVEK